MIVFAIVVFFIPSRLFESIALKNSLIFCVAHISYLVEMGSDKIVLAYL